MFLIKFGLIFFIVLNSVSFAFSQKQVPDFEVRDIYGNTHKLYADYSDKNKYVFIDFFSVGCQACRDLSPVLDSVYADFGCNGGDAVFLGIDGYYNDKDVFDFTLQYGMTFPAISGLDGGGGQVHNSFGIIFTPYTVLINPQGDIVFENPYQFAETYLNISDTLLKTGLTKKTCSGNDFLFYSLISGKDSVAGKINRTDKTVNVVVPSGTDLTRLIANFIADAKSTVKVNETEQISGETLNDFSNGNLIYEITSEDGNVQEWTVNVTASSVADILSKSINIFPNPVKSSLFVEINDYFFENVYAEIFNANGKQIKTVKLNNELSLIDVSGLPSGVYVLKIKTGKGIFFKKILKK